jgi:hypothetical protein
VIKIIPRRRGHGGQPLSRILEGEETEFSMGGTHDLENAMSNEENFVAEMVTQTTKDSLHEN